MITARLILQAEDPGSEHNPETARLERLVRWRTGLSSCDYLRVWRESQ